MKPKSRQYRGRLTSSEIAEGMNFARKNAQRLVRDARLLFDSQSYASCIALTILSIEESGKEPVLRGLAVARDGDELKEAWRAYRSHTKKNAMWPVLDTFLQGARRAQDFLPLFYPDAEHTYLLDQLKQVSLYTDCFGKARWSFPEQVVGQELAEGLLLIAEAFAQIRETTMEEIDLWIQYMGPAWNAPDGARESALFEWDKEMRRRGLIKEKEGSLTLEQFFIEGLHPPTES